MEKIDPLLKEMRTYFLLGICIIYVPFSKTTVVKLLVNVD